MRPMQGSMYRSSICQRLPLPIGVSWMRAEVEPRIGNRGTTRPPLELTFPVGAQPEPGANVAKSEMPSTVFSRPYQTTRTRRPESVPPTSEPNIRTKSCCWPRHTTGLVAALPLGSESECDPVRRNGSLPATTEAPPESDQPVLPFSSPPLDARL